MFPSKEAERQRIVAALRAAKTSSGLKGLPDEESIDALSMQLIASLRREEYYRLVQAKSASFNRTNPNSASFDPERAVAYHMQQGNVDEAGWLIFLMTYFAKPLSGWQRLKDVYGMLGAGQWDWITVTEDPDSLYDWVFANWQTIGGSFGNHRKYESLDPLKNRPFKMAVTDYLAWVGPAGHAAVFSNAVHVAGNDPHTIFNHLFGSLKVRSFGRLAKFDYLSLVSRYRLAPIEAGSAYLEGATGPGRGARLLIDGNPTSATSNAAIQNKLDEVDIGLKIGMTVMEDALCNWQKSPKKFIHYIG